MLRIPRRTTEVNANFSTPRQRGDGLRLDFSPQQSAFARINQAIGQGPRYRPVDVSSGGHAVAGVMDWAGNKMQKLIERNQEITDQRKLFQNETKLKAAQEQIALEITGEKDPTKHGEIYERRFGEAMQSLDFEGMSPYATEVMRQQADRLQKLGAIRTQMDSFKANEGLLLDEVDAGRKAAVATGNMAEVGRLNKARAEITGESENTTMHRTVLDGLAAGENARARTADEVNNLLELGRPEDALTLLQTDEYLALPQNENEKTVLIKKVETSKAMTEFKTSMLIDPKATKKALDSGESPYLKNATPEMGADMKKMVDIEVATRSNRSLNQIADDITQPGMRGQVLEILKSGGYKDLTDAARMEVINDLSKPTPSNDPREHYMTLKALANFQGGPDAELNETQITAYETTAKMKFSGPQLESVMRATTAARARIKGDATDEEKDPLERQILNLGKDGYFGVYNYPLNEIEEADLSPADRIKGKATDNEDTLFENQRLKAEAMDKQMRVVEFNRSLLKAKVPLHEREQQVQEMIDSMGLTLGYGKPPDLFSNPTMVDSALFGGSDNGANVVRQNPATERERLQKSLNAIEKARQRANASSSPNPTLPTK